MIFIKKYDSWFKINCSHLRQLDFKSEFHIVIFCVKLPLKIWSIDFVLFESSAYWQLLPRWHRRIFCHDSEPSFNWYYFWMRATLWQAHILWDVWSVPRKLVCRLGIVPCLILKEIVPFTDKLFRDLRTVFTIVWNNNSSLASTPSLYEKLFPNFVLYPSIPKLWNCFTLFWSSRS